MVVKSSNNICVISLLGKNNQNHLTLCKEFLAQLPGPGEDSVLAHPSHGRVNWEEFLIRIPRECNKLPLWLSLERWGCASHGSEELFGFAS